MLALRALPTETRVTPGTELEVPNLTPVDGNHHCSGRIPGRLRRYNVTGLQIYLSNSLRLCRCWRRLPEDHKQNGDRFDQCESLRHTGILRARSLNSRVPGCRLLARKKNQAKIG
jgi:hypothetical protein